MFTGRARRKEYWYFVLFHVIILIILNVISAAMGSKILVNLYNLAVLVPALAVTARRMHDVGKSGWFMLIPIYNLILECTPGDVGPNEYGADPINGAEFGADDYEKPFDINPQE